MIICPNQGKLKIWNTVLSSVLQDCQQELGRCSSRAEEILSLCDLRIPFRKLLRRQELFKFLAPGAAILGDVLGNIFLRDVWILFSVFLQFLVFFSQKGFETLFLLVG